MIRDDVFLSLYKIGDTVGSYDVEQRLGRRLQIDELLPCPLSCRYFLFGKPHITGTLEERAVLHLFYKMIKGSIQRNEVHAIRWKGGQTSPKQVDLLYYDEIARGLRSEKRALPKK